MNFLEQLQKVFGCDICLPQDAAQCAGIQFAVIWNNELRERFGASQNDVAAMLSFKDETDL